MRILSFAIIFILFSTHLTAQYKPQIRFKPGISRLFPSPGGKGYAYINNAYAYGSVVIGGEFSLPLKNKKTALQLGFTFQDMNTSLQPNQKNIVPINYDTTDPRGFYFLGAPAKTVVYAGFEKYLNRNLEKPWKNYFSVVSGAGFAFTLNKLKGWEYTRHQKYTSRKGELIEGVTSNYLRPDIQVGLSLYAGLRYNITNKKGNEVFIAELLFNYGITSFYTEAVDYKLNGMAQQDLLKEKGMNIQLNLIVPLFTFNKRKK